MAFVPTSPDDCTGTSVVVSGVHQGANYDFGTTNVGQCEPPFNCSPTEAVLTLDLTASTDASNPPGPDYASTFDLGTLEAYTYCVRVIYSAGQGITETVMTSIEVSPCT